MTGETDESEVEEDCSENDDEDTTLRHYLKQHQSDTLYIF